MIYALIAIGSFWFWFGCFFLAVLEIVAVDYESGRIASVILLAALALIASFTDFNPFLYVVQNPLTLLMWLAVYLCAGIAWGGARWWLYLLSAKDRYNEFRTEFLALRKLSTTDPLPEPVQRQLSRKAIDGGYKPLAIRNKARIVLWMTYWPFSAIWTILNDPLRRFFQFIYGRLLHRYQAVSDRVFRDFNKDFIEPPPEEDRYRQGGTIETKL